ncbi:Bud13/CWC26 family protein [Sporobolomyces koalae]|uniref:Bud13/CWC26 family protein n=1 Tax=Sporobolomyces koalae TaxID=500713 RepID=UPI00318078FD
MGNADLQAYLASKYMSGAKADAILERSADAHQTKKRKKRKDVGTPVASTSSGTGLRIADDDDAGWHKPDADEDEDLKPVVEERRGHFKAKAPATSTWATIRDADPQAQVPVEEEPPIPEDEAPVVVPSRGGLQSAADLKREQERLAVEQERKRIKRQREQEARRNNDQEPSEQETTVYRDSSGRKIDMKLQKAEEAKRKRQELEREMAKMEWGKGLVQREDKERMKLEAQKLARKGVARYADDEEMNDELKEVERWNDPAANFLTKSKSEKSKSKSKFPVYQGPPPPPNRFGIRPGYRWDGVDRGTGFEAKYMQKKNSASMYRAAAHAFSTEDM